MISRLIVRALIAHCHRRSRLRVYVNRRKSYALYLTLSSCKERARQSGEKKCFVAVWKFVKARVQKGKGGGGGKIAEKTKEKEICKSVSLLAFRLLVRSSRQLDDGMAGASERDPEIEGA